MKQRVLTAIALAVPCLAALAWPGYGPVAFLCLLVALLGASEAGRLLGYDGSVLKRPPVYGAALALALFVLCQRVYSGGTVAFSDNGPRCLLGLAVGGAGAYFGQRRVPFAVLAGFWTVAPMFALLSLHQMDPASGWSLRNPVLLALLPVWAGDIAAIFVGKAFGKRPLAPKISPKKTVEGAIGNALAALATGALLGLWLPAGPALGALCGLLAERPGQAGDLFESALKRRVGLKDSGTLLPGHGGILDRVDSLLFAAPAVLLVLGW